MLGLDVTLGSRARVLSTAGRGGLGDAGLEVTLGSRAQVLSTAHGGGLGDAELEVTLGSRETLVPRGDAGDAGPRGGLLAVLLAQGNSRILPRGLLTVSSGC